MNKQKRIRRGFHRIGVVLALPFALAALVYAAGTLSSWSKPDPMVAVKVPEGSERHRYKATGPRGVSYVVEVPKRYSDEELTAMFEQPMRESQERYDAIQSGLGWTLGLPAAALVFYGGPWLLGWIVAGFMRDDAHIPPPLPAGTEIR